MIHFIYKTSSKSGKYYIGRHSTENINDRYLGSGKWIRSIEDKSLLSREILEFTDSFEILKKLEKQYLEENIGRENCMNFNNEPVGFGTGILNPSCTLEGKKRLVEQRKGRIMPCGDNHYSKNNPENTARLSKKFKDNNPSTNPVIMAKIAIKTSERMKIKNPMFDPVNRALISEKGNFTKNNPSHIEYTCPYCNKIGKGGRFKSYHLLKQICMENK